MDVNTFIENQIKNAKENLAISHCPYSEQAIKTWKESLDRWEFIKNAVENYDWHIATEKPKENVPLEIVVPYYHGDEMISENHYFAYYSKDDDVFCLFDDDSIDFELNEVLEYRYVKARNGEFKEGEYFYLKKG